MTNSSSIQNSTFPVWIRRPRREIWEFPFLTAFMQPCAFSKLKSAAAEIHVVDAKTKMYFMYGVSSYDKAENGSCGICYRSETRYASPPFIFGCMVVVKDHFTSSVRFQGLYPCCVISLAFLSIFLMLRWAKPRLIHIAPWSLWLRKEWWTITTAAGAAATATNSQINEVASRKQKCLYSVLCK